VEKLTAPHGSAGDDGAADDGTALRDEISIGSGDRPPPRVAAPRAGDPVGDFEKFYAANFDRLIVQLYAYTADMAQAQDVVQEAFARALPRWERLRTYSDPVGWVRRVALNLATSRWRQVRTFRRFASGYREEHVDGPTPDRVALASALSTLPANQRRVIVQFYLADMTVAQIAHEDGIPDGTVKSWLHRGRAALAASLGESRVEVPDA
jgi:RNA polymerase sigma-70 factor, ECF subfamily